MARCFLVTIATIISGVRILEILAVEQARRNQPATSRDRIRPVSRCRVPIASAISSPFGEHKHLWGGIERSMSPSLNFDGTGGCEEGKTSGRENC
jgi:hypothetical protein